MKDIEITGPHGYKDGKDFFHIHQVRETDKLSRYLQFLFWRTCGYEMFGYCFAGYILAWRIS